MEPGFLIASPQMHDPNFRRTVVLLAHHDSEGALGLIINREHSVSLGDVVMASKLPGGWARRPVMRGGPVEGAAGFVIFKGRAPEGWELPGGLVVSASKDRLEALLAAGQEFHLCLGYAGWGPGQLDREFETGSWVYIEATADLVFETPIAERYDLALSRLGVTAGSLWMNPVDE